MAWNSSSELIVGGSGQVSVAPSGTALPTTTTGALNAAFMGLGYHSEDGLSISVTPQVTDFFVWQSRQPARRESQAQEILISFALAQWDEDTVPLAFGGGTISGSTPNYRYDFPTDTQALAEVSLVADVVDGSKNLRFVFSRGNVTEPVESKFSRSDLATLAIGFKALAPAGGGSPGYFLSDSPGFAAGS